MEVKFIQPSVRLVAYTKPAEDMRPDEFVGYCARVSNPANQYAHDTAPKLLKYLRDNHHWSPFEMASATLAIKTSRDIGRQILRHRTFSFQEFSQRYAEVTEFVPRTARAQDKKNRQMSHDVLHDDDKDWFNAAQEEVLDMAVDLYTGAIEKGIAKECARALLPEGLTATTMYMSGTLRSWYHYVMLRGGNGTQLEHMDIAEKCRAALATVYPSLFEMQLELSL